MKSWDRSKWIAIRVVIDYWSLRDQSKTWFLENWNVDTAENESSLVEPPPGARLPRLSSGGTSLPMAAKHRSCRSPSWRILSKARSAPVFLRFSLFSSTCLPTLWLNSSASEFSSTHPFHHQAHWASRVTVTFFDTMSQRLWASSTTKNAQSKC